MAPATFNAFKFANTIIFLLLSCIHFYWAFHILFTASTRLMNATVPEANGKPLFAPSFGATLLVAVGLLVFAFLSAWGIQPIYKGMSPFMVSPWWCVYGNLSIAIIFLLRSIGDFKYVGFFKKIEGTAFARNDTRFYSPLCLFIAVVAFCICWSIWH